MAVGVAEGDLGARWRRQPARRAGRRARCMRVFGLAESATRRPRAIGARRAWTGSTTCAGGDDEDVALVASDQGI